MRRCVVAETRQVKQWVVAKDGSCLLRCRQADTADTADAVFESGCATAAAAAARDVESVRKAHHPLID